MGFKDFFFAGRSSRSSTSTRPYSNLKAQAYDSVVALEAPVRGSYPVAGNGPNVFDEIQRSRAKRDGKRQSTIVRTPSGHNPIAEPPPDISRWREAAHERPQTAPHNGRLGGGGGGYNRAGAEGRTRSGFTTRTPPVFPNVARRNSLQSIGRESFLPPMPPTLSNPSLRDIKAYQSTKAADVDEIFTAPFATQHQRSDSTSSHKSHVDILDAHSNIRPSREASNHRAKASGVRHYGEDVADRNIAEHGSKPFDPNSDEFSYLKTLYSAGAPRAFIDVPSPGSSNQGQAVSALGHVLGPHSASSSVYGDDMSPKPSTQPLRTHAVAQSLRSNNSFAGSHTPPPPRSGASSGPAVPVAQRGEAVSRQPFPHKTNKGGDDRSNLSPISNGNDRVRALSPLSNSTSSIYEEGLEDRPAPPLPARGRDRTVRQNPPPAANPSGSTQLRPPVKISNPVPVSAASYTPQTSPSVEAKHHAQPVSVVATTKTRPEARKGASVSFSSAPPENIQPAKYPPPSLKDRKRTMSQESQNSFTAGHKPKNGSVSYSPYPYNSGRASPHGSAHGSTQGSSHGSDSTTRSSTAQKRMLVQGSKEPPSLKGIVDLSNTVDTNVTTKTLPAVVHEHVTPTRHEIREERVTREIHYHDVFHRILPVIETVILPTKHFIHSPDGTFLIEIPEIDVPKYTGRPLETINQGWKLVRTTEPTVEGTSHTRNDSIQRKLLPASTNSEQLIEQFQSYGPVIHKGSANGEAGISAKHESKPNHAGLASISTRTGTTSVSNNLPEPVLISKKEYIAKEGYPRTEYVWRHPPVFEDAQGRMQPIHIKGVTDELDLTSLIRSSSDEEDASGLNFGALNSGGPLFADAGYGVPSVLPGLGEMSTERTVQQQNDYRGLASKDLNAKSSAGTLPQHLKGHPSLVNKTSGGNAPPNGASVQSVNGRPKNSDQTRSSTKAGDGVMVGEPDDKIRLGRVLNKDGQPEPAKPVEKGEASGFLHRLKEKRLSSGSTNSIFRSWSKSRSKENRKSVGTGEVEKLASSMKVN